ncbi:hypothetical protein T440DRAFT_520475 [Plenodomus tracheiphilus IPT5]|uniref:F-box domain-containing protein n=1 Tax=Plenodomus tracheiphilus IPT5 TaxID=1408161 RepID=A0A6A7AYA6_9PLEO|nr:hypothetical protein T440DRAFT_520475 [Plenodomus tracheiphilus IPT5]
MDVAKSNETTSTRHASKDEELELELILERIKYALHIDLPDLFYLSPFTRAEVNYALNRRASPLLALPGELRNLVYAFYFKTTRWFISDNPSDSRVPIAHAPSLPRVSRQLRHETLLISFSHGIIATNNPTLFPIWLNSRTTYETQAITRLELSCSLLMLTPRTRAWRFPMKIEDDMHALRQFPNLNRLHLHVQVSGQGRGPDPPQESHALIHIVRKKIQLQELAPRLNLSASDRLMHDVGHRRMRIQYAPLIARNLITHHQVEVPEIAWSTYGHWDPDDVL